MPFPTTFSADNRILLVVLIVVAGFCVSVVFHYVVGGYLSKPWPATSFLNTPDARFGDFKLVVFQSAGLNPFENDVGGFAGTPFAQFVGYLFSLIRWDAVQLAIYLGLFFVTFVPAIRMHLYGFKSKLTLDNVFVLFALIFLTYPVLFALDRANFDLIVAPILLFFVWAYQKQRIAAATGLLALAIALKPYTAVFLVVYAIDKRYRHALLTVLTAVFLGALSLSVFRDGLVVETQKYLNALFTMANDPTFGSDFVYTSDIFSGLVMLTSSVAGAFHQSFNLADYQVAKVAYFALAGIVGLYVILQLWRQPGPLWKQISVLAILVILLPANSHDYRLLYLFPPLLAYLVAPLRPKYDLLLAILWGLLLIPKSYWPLNSTQNIGMIINPMLLIAILVFLLPEAFSWKGVVSLFSISRRPPRAEGSVELENAV